MNLSGAERLHNQGKLFMNSLPGFLCKTEPSIESLSETSGEKVRHAIFILAVANLKTGLLAWKPVQPA
jgi:hypothetical protein